MIILMWTIDALARCIIFKKRDIKWWKALIPGYNKYLLGKLSDNKRLGKINMILVPFTIIYFLACFLFETWIIKSYSYQVIIPYQASQASQISVKVPDYIANVAIYSKYALIILVVIAMVYWTKLMYNFTKLHQKSNWLVLFWALCPPISYIYFAITKDTYINGKLYTMERVIKHG